MQVTLEAIKFNHDPQNASADAFNIRKNEYEPVPFPEWQRGKSFTADDSLAAYAMNPIGRTLTIQAKFKSSAPNSTIKVMAVDASSPLLPGNVLGTVKENDVTFGANGESGFVPFVLENVRLGSVGVGISKVNWRWQFRIPPTTDWTDFAKTAHRIYSVVNVPEGPWSQEDDVNDTQLPWTEVLDVACDWAAGAKTVEKAAELITRNVYDLGHHLVGYQGSPAAYALANFNCTDFLALLRGGVGMGKCLNCSDCATIVSTFANILGCDTFQVQFYPAFTTNPIVVIGASNPDGDHFEDHEVAWTGATEEQGAVCDACLQVDGDEEPRDCSHFEALLPTNLPFLTDYKFRVDRTDRIKPILPGQRRPVGSCVEANLAELDARFLKALKDHYCYEKWKDIPCSGISHWMGLSAARLASHQILDKVNERTQRFVDGTVLEQTLFRVVDTNVLIREDVFECRNESAARVLLLRLLGQYKSIKLERLEHPIFADVAFLATDGSSALFAISRQVVLISADCPGKMPLREAELQPGDSQWTRNF